MKRPSSRMTPNTVTITKAAFVKDVAAGRQLTPGAAGPPIACSVQQQGNETTGRAGAQRAVGSYKVLFHDDPGLAIRDALTWLDGGNAILTVTGVGNAAGRARTWVIDCTEVK